MIVSTLVKESGGLTMRAEVHRTDDVLSVKFYNPAGLIKTESYPGKSLHFVEECVENWFAGIKVLNG